MSRVHSPPLLLLVLALLMGQLSLAQESDAAKAMALAREAAEAAAGGDLATYLARMKEAVALRPDFPRMLVNLAAAQVANDLPEEAVATLEQLAVLGLSSPVEKSAEFVAVRDRRDFQAVARKLAANLQSKGQGQIAFSLREVTGLIEGIAWREKTGDFFFGDVNGRAVWRRKPDGSLQRFSPDGDELLGVFGLAVDEIGGALWLATAAVPAMSGFAPEMDGMAALVQLDLDSGVVREIVAVPHAGGGGGSHVFGDLALGRDGSVFVTDSGAPIIWHLAPGAHALELLVESEEFISLQGIVVSREGTELVVADHANGLLAIDLGSRSIRRLEAPPHTTLIGLDGLALALNGDVVAIQNGLRPNRVLRIGLSANAGQIEGVEVLESGHLTMAAPSLGCIAVDGQFFYIGNAGWTRFENTEGRPSEPRTVPIFRTRL